MPVTRQQYDAVMKIARVNRGIKIDMQSSSRYAIHLVHGKKNKRWIVDGAGKISKA